MIVINIATEETGVVNGDAIAVLNKTLRGSASLTCVCQVKITGTLTTILQGRLTPSSDWVTLKQFTTSGIDATIPVVPEMRFSSTSGAGTLNSMDVGIIPR